VTHKFSDSVSQSDNENNKSKSVDVEMLPLLRKNALRKSFARRKLLKGKTEGDFIKHKVFKARIGAVSQTNQWSQHKVNINKTSMMHIENFEYTDDDEDEDDDSDSSSSSMSYLTNNFKMPKRLSNITKNSEQISLFTPVKG